MPVLGTGSREGLACGHCLESPLAPTRWGQMEKKWGTASRMPFQRVKIPARLLGVKFGEETGWWDAPGQGTEKRNLHN